MAALHFLGFTANGCFRLWPPSAKGTLFSLVTGGFGTAEFQRQLWGDENVKATVSGLPGPVGHAIDRNTQSLAAGIERLVAGATAVGLLHETSLKHRTAGASGASRVVCKFIGALDCIVMIQN